jgi:hypothetical protein
MGKEKEVEKKTSKVRVRFYTDGKATIYRNDGLPTIDDKSPDAVAWLGTQGFKPSEIEVTGDKPECWNVVFPEPAPEPVAA